MGVSLAMPACRSAMTVRAGFFMRIQQFIGAGRFFGEKAAGKQGADHRADQQHDDADCQQDDFHHRALFLFFAFGFDFGLFLLFSHDSS